MSNFDFMNNLESVHVIWMMFCICLLVFMQLGFNCLEAGLVRDKNSINVVMKNSLDFCISILTFFFIGSVVMFAPLDEMGATFASHFFTNSANTNIPIMFHAMFCATAVTITSGAVVERMSLKGYLLTAVITALIIYPLSGRLIWGDLFYPDQDIALLANLGFVDFAGATAVHALGGAIALAAAMVIGPRMGRFGSDSQPIRPSSLPLASVGIFLLWVGWFGFNGGSQMMVTEQTSSILFVTLLGGLSGMASAAIYSEIKEKNLDVLSTLNGGLSGLVAITAGADFLAPWQALFIGAIAGLFTFAVEPILEKFKIDDGIGVVPVHLVSGIWGTTAVGLFMPLSENQTRFELTAIQFFGSVFIVTMAFLISFLLLKYMSRFVNLRVATAGEIVGLNVWEHRASTSQIDLIQQMSAQAELGLFNHRVTVEPYTSEHDIATFYNSVLEKFNELQTDKEKALREAVWLAEHDALTGTKNRRAITHLLTQEQNRIDRSRGNSSVAIIDLDHFKKVNDNYGHDNGDIVLKHFVTSMERWIRKTDVFGRLGGEEFVLLLIDTPLEKAVQKLNEIRESTAASVIKLEDAELTITISIGVAQIRPSDSVDLVLKRADNALYRAKREGRNKVYSE